MSASFYKKNSITAVIFLALSSRMECFAPIITTTSLRRYQHQSSLPTVLPRTLCFLAKPKKKPPQRSAGGGFGDSTSPADNKVRTVSGFTGSGTKPLRVTASTFDRLRKDFGVKACNDVYVKSPLNDPELFWFVGKVARCIDADKLQGSSIPTPEEAVLSQKRLILEYAKRELRPQNLGGPFSEGLELWLAPGDSELEAVQNKVWLDEQAELDSRW
jgi:hypothetical protein